MYVAPYGTGWMEMDEDGRDVQRTDMQNQHHTRTQSPGTAPAAASNQYQELRTAAPIPVWNVESAWLDHASPHLPSPHLTSPYLSSSHFVSSHTLSSSYHPFMLSLILSFFLSFSLSFRLAPRLLLHDAHRHPVSISFDSHRVQCVHVLCLAHGPHTPER